MPQILASFPPAFSLCQAEIIAALESRHLKPKSLCRWDMALQTGDVLQGGPPGEINGTSRVRQQIDKGRGGKEKGEILTQRKPVPCCSLHTLHHPTDDC